MKNLNYNINVLNYICYQTCIDDIGIIRLEQTFGLRR